MKGKRFLAVTMAIMMTLGLTACGSGGSEQSTPEASGGEAVSAETMAAMEAPEEADMSDWEIAANIYDGDETDEELYEKAKEEGTVTLYSISSRSPKVAEAFNAKYPGVKCVSFDIATNELLEKLTREYDAGQRVADVVHIKDEDGSLYQEYVQDHVLYNYKPTEIMSHIKDEYKTTMTPLYIELTQLFYNEEAYPDGSPIKNIWEITDPQWKGRIMMQNPLDNVSWGAWITGFCVGDVPDQLEAAYKEWKGEDLTLSDGCDNAGYEFLKRLHDNTPIYASSSDEVAESVGTRGQTNPPIGFSSSSKVRKNKDNDWCLVPINLEPTVGIPLVNTLYIVEGCEHPYAAKLLTRFMMGGTDGDTSGYDPFNTLGGWPVRDDIPAAEGSTPFAELNVASFDQLAIYNNVNKVRDFWTLLN